MELLFAKRFFAYRANITSSPSLLFKHKAMDGWMDGWLEGCLDGWMETMSMNFYGIQTKDLCRQRYAIILNYHM